MPDLYVVILLWGMVMGTVGPLPYDKSHCEERIVPLREDAEAGWKPGIQHRGREIKRGDLTFKCEYHLVRPKFDPKLGPGD